MIFLLLFTVLPALELILLFEVSHSLGSLNTLLLILFTGIFGFSLIRHQGLSLYSDVTRNISQGHLPQDALLNGFLIFLGGVFLITPGVLTDVFGFCLALPLTRHFFVAVSKKIIEKKIKEGAIHVYTQNRSNSSRTKPRSQPQQIFYEQEDVMSSDIFHEEKKSSQNVIDLNERKDKN